MPSSASNAAKDVVTAVARRNGRDGDEDGRRSNTWRIAAIVLLKRPYCADNTRHNANNASSTCISIFSDKSPLILKYSDVRLCS